MYIVLHPYSTCNVGGSALTSAYILCMTVCIFEIAGMKHHMRVGTIMHPVDLVYSVYYILASQVHQMSLLSRVYTYLRSRLMGHMLNKASTLT